MTADVFRHFVHRGVFAGGADPRYPFDWRPTYHGCSALLLVCAGDGRHWVNVTNSCPRAQADVVDGMGRHIQVLGLVPVEAVEETRRLLGVFPHQGDAYCAKCGHSGV
jgi:hypothetical protein